MKIKRCTKCGLDKPLEDFYLDSKGKEKSHCKSCHKLYVVINYQKNSARFKAYQKAYRLKNKEMLKEKRRKYTKKNMRAIYLYLRKRNETKRGLRADLTEEQWETIKRVFRGKCAYCGKRTTVLEQDHVIPLSKGGTLTLHNIVPACRSCNAQKYNHLPNKPVRLVLL